MRIGFPTPLFPFSLLLKIQQLGKLWLAALV
jgi:hypothetical protein